MSIEDEIILSDCPLCEGPSLLEEEGNSYYIMCMECGCHTVNVSFKGEDQRKNALEKAAMLWERGKVISSQPGE